MNADTYGLDFSHVDTSVRLADDLYRHFNGAWLKSAEIPADRSSDGALMMLRELSEKQVREMTVSMAVMELDLTESQTIVFRNAAHGGLSVVYRRPDGNIGWIDPERTKSPNGNELNGTQA